MKIFNFLKFLFKINLNLFIFMKKIIKKNKKKIKNPFL